MRKILHRIYFGFDRKPDPYMDYLETWKTELPDFEIMHWSANNLPINNCFFSKKMYELRDHAFLSDYFRWWVLKNYGGVYFDADIEVVNGKKFRLIFNDIEESDELDGAIGIDKKEGGWYTAHSMIMKKDSPITKFMCNVYESMGELCIWRRKIFYFMAPQLTALYFCSNGYNVDGMGSCPNLDTTTIIHRIKIYPQDYFSPLSPAPKNTFVIDAATENTCICHHFSCSWHDSSSEFKKNAEKNKNMLYDILKMQKKECKMHNKITKKLNNIYKKLIKY